MSQTIYRYVCDSDIEKIRPEITACTSGQYFIQRYEKYYRNNGMGHLKKSNSKSTHLVTPS